MFATVLPKALGWETDEEILKLFIDETEVLPVDGNLVDRVLVSSVVDQETGGCKAQQGGQRLGEMEV
jgi:hypothetical protein